MPNTIEDITKDRLILKDDKFKNIFYIISSFCITILALYFLLKNYYNNQYDPLLFVWLFLGIFSVIFHIYKLVIESYVILDKKHRCVIIGDIFGRRTIPFGTIQIVSDFDDEFGYFYTLFLGSELIFETVNETEIKKVADIISEFSGKGIVP